MLLGLHVDALFAQIAKCALLKATGELQRGVTVRFLGRLLRHDGRSISIMAVKDYVESMLVEMGLQRWKASPTPGVKPTSGLLGAADSINALDSATSTQFRRMTGMLLWLVPIRPDINYSVKELSRSLQSPTILCLGKLTHVLRYLKGAHELCAVDLPAVLLGN